MERLAETQRLTAEEKTAAATYASGEWAMLSRDDLTKIEVWIKREGNLLRVREIQPQEVSQGVIDHNTAARSYWQGWSAKANRVGAAVTSIPTTIWHNMVRACGYEAGSGDYDRKKFRRMINDGDYAKFKLVDGKI